MNTFELVNWQLSQRLIDFWVLGQNNNDWCQHRADEALELNTVLLFGLLDNRPYKCVDDVVVIADGNVVWVE